MCSWGSACSSRWGTRATSSPILRSKDLGLSNTEAVSAYVLFNATYSLLAWPAGAASDRLERRNVIGAGYAVFALVYLGFALAGTGTAAWPLFAVYGCFMALTEGVGKALVTDLVPALGVYTGAIGATVLVSSVMAGVLWDAIGPGAPFALGVGNGVDDFDIGTIVLSVAGAMLILAGYRMFVRGK